jgi:hypothetical protein
MNSMEVDILRTQRYPWTTPQEVRDLEGWSWAHTCVLGGASLCSGVMTRKAGHERAECSRLCAKLLNVTWR